MSRLSEYKQLFYDGACLEAVGQTENACMIYRAIVEKCAYSDTMHMDCLIQIYGSSAYDIIDTYAKAIEASVIALCCKEFMEVVFHKFGEKDRLISDNSRKSANINSFFYWLSKSRKPCSSDYKVLKEALNSLRDNDYVLVSMKLKNVANSLQELLSGMVLGKYRV